MDLSLIMARLIPVIHAVAAGKKDVDVRAFASPKGLRSRRRVRFGHDQVLFRP